MFSSKYFGLGRILITQAINDELPGNEQFSIEVLISLRRYCLMDWGTVSDESRHMNDSAVENGTDRIFAQYETSKGDIWIITEADRSATTVMFPSDY